MKNEKNQAHQWFAVNRKNHPQKTNNSDDLAPEKTS
jgi:hypothetical protein